MYYTIQNGSILTSNNRNVLIKFYNEALELPNDYEEGKYIVVNDELVLNPNWEEIDLQKKKALKIQENDAARDNALAKGVIYNGILFDSDTDQKINLLANISSMEDEDTITWFGMNNEALICTKVDLLQIGELIKELHTFCWTKNAEIKAEIAEAETVEEVNDIEIDYEEINEDTANSDN